MLRCSISPVNNQEKDLGILKNSLVKHNVVFCCYEGHKTMQNSELLLNKFWIGKFYISEKLLTSFILIRN